jgi:hypothetical protein
MTMKRVSTLLVAAFFLTTGVVKSQAPMTGTTLSSLQDMITGNKALLDAQKKTLDTLDQLDQDAQQLKIFGKRG